jgi:hypothetical protein
MKHGCLAILGLGLISLFVFGVTLEAVNDPNELTAIPFCPLDFLTYCLVALAIVALVRLTRRKNPRKTLPGKWASVLMHEGGRFRTALRIDTDGHAEFDTKGKIGGADKSFRINAQWQLLDERTLHFVGAQNLTWKILKLNNFGMTTAATGESSPPVHWIRHPRTDTKALLLVAAAILLPVFIALSLPRSGPPRAIANDPKDVLPEPSYHGHR